MGLLTITVSQEGCPRVFIVDSDAVKSRSGITRGGARMKQQLRRAVSVESGGLRLIIFAVERGRGCIGSGVVVVIDKVWLSVERMLMRSLVILPCSVTRLGERFVKFTPGDF
ncbi:unnamed protein product [Lampetra planeri]